MLSDLFHGFVGGLFKFVVVHSAEAILAAVGDRHERYREQRSKRQEETSNENLGSEVADGRDKGNGSAEDTEHQVYIPEFYEPPRCGEDYCSKAESFPQEPVDSDAFPKFRSYGEEASDRQRREGFYQRWK